MRVLKSWSFYITLCLVGVGLFLISGYFPKPRIEFLAEKGLILKGPGSGAAPVYDEVKFWAETAGKVFGGIGGAGVGVKAVVEFFKRKRKR